MEYELCMIGIGIIIIINELEGQGRKAETLTEGEFCGFVWTPRWGGR
jgi:hypothetical protein